MPRFRHQKHQKYSHGLGSMNSLALYKRLLSYARPYWPAFVVAGLCMVLIAATETAFPAMMKPLLDSGFRGVSTFQVWWVPVAVLLIFGLRGISGFCASYAMSWIANNVLRDLRRAMFNKLICMPASSFDEKSTGQLISRVIAEVNGVTSAATNVVNTLARDTLILIGLLGWLFWLNWKLTLIVLLLLPALAALTWAFSKRMRNVSRGALQATSEMTRVVEQAIYGNRVVKVFQGEAFERERFERANASYRGQSMRLVIAQALQTPISQFIAAIGVAVILTIALVQSREGTATVGDFVSFITAMLMMLTPLRHLADVNSFLQRGLAAAESVFSLIDEQGERDSGTKILGQVKGDIAFENVRLQYASDGRMALDGINLQVRAGQTVALVGPSGGGKSSLVNLLPRLYEPTSGVIRVDGVPISELTLSALRSQIALVSQDVVLFNDTIFNNLAYPGAHVTDEDIWAALEVAGLDQFVRSLPEQLNTYVGDRGVKVSGGQRQRIAIARAVLKNAPILILDEATSALDSVTESGIKEAIDRLRKNRTTLVVAHRLTTIQNADHIVVIGEGKIIEQGDHQGLLKNSGVYASLYAALNQEAT